MRGPTVLAIIVLAALASSCGDDGNPVDPSERLCGGEGGFGVRIAGKASLVDGCLPDDNIVENVERGVQVIFTVAERYDIRVQWTDSEGTAYEMQLLFAHRDGVPPAVDLNMTGDLGIATADPDWVWVYYKEIPTSGEAVESSSVAGGGFRLTFTDRSVAAGTFSGATILLRTVSGGEQAGSRVIEEGFFSITTDG